MSELTPDHTLPGTEPRAIALRLESAFERVHRERMHDVPILNTRLGVKAVGTRETEAGWLSALVTPWFINLMLLPRTSEQDQSYRALRRGSTVAHVFPAGRFEFIVGEEADLGRYQMCSLFSPVLEFESQGAALITAESALTVLFDARLAPDALQAADPSSQDGAGEAELRPRSGDEETRAAKLSRRGLFFGRDAESGGIEP